MIKNKFKGFSVEELINNQDFINSVKQFSSKIEWQNFLIENPLNKYNIIQSKKIIELLSVQEEKLDIDRKRDLWSKILAKSNENKSHKHRILWFGNLYKAAAVITILLCLGVSLYTYIIKDHSEYKFSANINSSLRNTVLIMPSGKTVELNFIRSTVDVLKNKSAIRVNNDTIIKNDPVKAENEKENHLTEVVVPYGKTSVLTLSDGTRVWLNAGTRLAFPQSFKGKYRGVFLDGEGYFEVTKNAAKKFIVSSLHTSVEVFGTKFNLNDYSTDKKSKTTLLEGSVRLSEKNQIINNSVMLKPGQSGICNAKSGTISVQKESNLEKCTSWRNGWYEFDNTNIREVLIRLERYYNVSFRYDEKTIRKALPVSGKLDLKDSIDNVMSVISNVANIKYEINKNKIKITK